MRFLKSKRVLLIIGFQIIAVVIVIGVALTLINRNNNDSLNNQTIKQENNNTIIAPIISYPIQEEEIEPLIPSYAINMSQYVGESFNYQMRVYKNWISNKVGENTVQFSNENKLILTVKDIETTLSPEEWYQQNFSNTFSQGEPALINGLEGFVAEYINTTGTYKDYVVKVGNFIVHFKFTIKEGKINNTSYIEYVDYLVNTVSDVGI